MPRSPRPFSVLLAASLLCLVLGSIHGFSVFVEPLEARYNASRALVSLTYSLALVALTLAVLAGPWVFRLVSPWMLAIGVGAVGGVGSLIAGAAPNLGVLWLGYSLLFGAANGIGYGFSLQAAGQAFAASSSKLLGPGAAMGVVTAAYALGAALSPALYVYAIEAGGVRLALLGLAVALVGAALLAALLLKSAQARLVIEPQSSSAGAVSRRVLALLWLGYGAGAAAGLMAIGHAVGIAKSAGMIDRLWLAAAVIASANLVGSLLGGSLIDRIAPRSLFVTVAMVTAVALVRLSHTDSVVFALTCLAAIGGCYGCLIAATPAAIAKRVGPGLSTRVYGQVFTAWGLAGLSAPWLAGWLYDRNGNYEAALFVAAGLAVVSAIAALLVKEG